MRLSIDGDYFIRRFGEEGAIKILKKAGFDAIDYSFFSLYCDTEKKDIVFGDNYIEYAKKVRKILDETGLVCNQAHAPFLSSNQAYTEYCTDEYIDSIVKSIEMASILGADNIILHAIWEDEGETMLETNYKFYKQFEKYCEKFNIHIAVENLFGRPYDETIRKYSKNRFGKPDTMKEFINMLDSPWFVCCVDTGHSTIVEGGVEPEEFIRSLDNKILKALHVQDNDYTNDLHIMPYVGKINWNNVTQALHDIDYKGDITFEFSNFINKFDDDVIEDALKLAESVGRKLIRKIVD